jgi:ATP-binding cassette subfamily F protein 3
MVADGDVKDFDGDLDDYASWLEKRGSAVTTPSQPKPRGDERGKKRKDPKPNQHEIKTIETSLGKLGQERQKLEKELESLDYARDPAHARRVTERHVAVLRDVEQLETRWLELSERLESADG